MQAARFAAALALSMFPAIAPAQSGGGRLGPEHYREIPFAEIERPPVGAPVSSGPVIGLREDKVRVKAQYTGRTRESTKADTRLRDAWTRSQGLVKPGEKSKWFEYEFTDGSRRVWLPVSMLGITSFMEARPNDEYELYLHRVDAPLAGAELPGSETLIMGAVRAKTKPAAAGLQPGVRIGALQFTFRGTRVMIGLKPGGASKVSEGKALGEPTSILLDLQNPDGSEARIEVAGIRGPGLYTPTAIAIELPPGGPHGGPNVVDVRGCKVRVQPLNPPRINGSLECPAGENRPADAIFTVVAR
jgi:hypothetical protein